MFLGIDLTSSDKRPSACALLDANAQLVSLQSLATDSEILALSLQYSPSVVAIDSPLGFPKGMCCLEESCQCKSEWSRKGRVCEWELVKRGIPLYFTTKRSIIKQMTYRAIALAAAFRQQGCDVLEVYPYASKVALFGKAIPKKTTQEGLDFLHTRLSELVGRLNTHEGRFTHDLYDALMASYTGYLHSLGKTEFVGIQEEVCIVMPALTA